jgi:hypothetical protein
MCEVIANFCGYRVPRGQRDGSLRPDSRFSRQEPLLFYKVAPQLYSRGWVDTVPDPLLFFVVPGNRTRDPCICSQELWPLDHRGGHRYRKLILISVSDKGDLLCGLVLKVLGYRSGGPGSVPGTTRKKNVVGLERGPLSLVSTTEELLDRKVAAPV